MLLSGEPGIGKSRLTAALEDSLKGEAHICLRYFCQPHHQGSALAADPGQLAHAAGFDRRTTPRPSGAPSLRLCWRRRRESPQRRRACSRSSLASRQRHSRSRPIWTRSASGAPLLKRSSNARSADAPPPGADAVRGCALGRPDLDRIADADHRAAAEPAGPARHHVSGPDYQPPWTGQPHVTMLALNRLSRANAPLWSRTSPAVNRCRRNFSIRSSTAPTACRCSSKNSPRPLLESEQLQVQGDRYLLDQPSQPLAIPSTLQASLMARVDRLGSAREVLQIGAAIGREFSYEVLAAVAGSAGRGAARRADPAHRSRAVVLARHAAERDLFLQARAGAGHRLFRNAARAAPAAALRHRAGA